MSSLFSTFSVISSLFLSDRKDRFPLDVENGDYYIVPWFTVTRDSMSCGPYLRQLVSMCFQCVHAPLMVSSHACLIEYSGFSEMRWLRDHRDSHGVFVARRDPILSIS